MIEPKGMRWIVAGLAVIALSGCRVKSYESFESAVNPSPPAPGKGDPYTYGGIAEGTGGIQPRTSYASDDKSSDPLGRTESGKAGRLEAPRVNVAGGATNIDLAAGGQKPPAGQKPASSSATPGTGG